MELMQKSVDCSCATEYIIKTAANEALKISLNESKISKFKEKTK